MVRLRRDPTVRSTPPWVRVVCATQERGLVYAHKGRGQAGAGAWVHPVSNPASHPERSEGSPQDHAPQTRRSACAAKGQTRGQGAHPRIRRMGRPSHSFSLRFSMIIGEVCSRRICSRPRKILTDRSARFECACVKRGVGQAREGKHAVAKKRGWFSLVHALRPHHPRWDNLMAQAHSAVALRPRQPLRVLRVAVPQTA